MQVMRFRTGGAIIDRDDRRARFEAEVLPHLDAAYRFARWLCRGPDDAEDIVHDAVIRAFRAFDGARIADPKAWLLAIVRNCHLTGVQRRRAEVSLSDLAEDSLGETTEAPPTPEDVIVRQDGSRVLERLLGSLPLVHREVLVLRELEELSYREIAKTTGVPMGTVMSRIARARTALMGLWQQENLRVNHGLR
jgi:RNA polymerase sigma-70 factor (ECF subfamily)